MPISIIMVPRKKTALIDPFRYTEVQANGDVGYITEPFYYLDSAKDGFGGKVAQMTEPFLGGGWRFVFKKNWPHQKGL